MAELQRKKKAGTDLIIRKIISAPREIVYQSWIDSLRLQKWWALNDKFETTVVQLDLKIGGEYRLGMKETNSGNEFIVTGKYISIVPPQLLEYSWRWENESGGYNEESHVKVEFISREDSTELVITHSRLYDSDVRHEHEIGWNECLKQLASVMETINEMVLNKPEQLMEDEMSTLTIEDFDKKLAEAEMAVTTAKSNVALLRRSRPREVVQDYELTKLDGSKVNISELFGDKSDLMLVHNMGKSCPYCTLWADGFNGLTDHIENRTAYALVSNDDPKTAKEFSSSRNWRFTVLSGAESDFAADMGFTNPKDNTPTPGVSTFRKEDDGTIIRIGKAWFGPGDDFCGIWHLFDLLADGTGDWAPKFSYK